MIRLKGKLQWMAVVANMSARLLSRRWIWGVSRWTTIRSNNLKNSRSALYETLSRRNDILRCRRSACSDRSARHPARLPILDRTEKRLKAEGTDQLLEKCLQLKMAAADYQHSWERLTRDLDTPNMIRYNIDKSGLYFLICRYFC